MEVEREGIVSERHLGEAPVAVHRMTEREPIRSIVARRDGERHRSGEAATEANVDEVGLPIDVHEQAEMVAELHIAEPLTHDTATHACDGETEMLEHPAHQAVELIAPAAASLPDDLVVRRLGRKAE